MPGFKPIILTLISVTVIVSVWYLNTLQPEPVSPKNPVKPEIDSGTNISLDERVRSIEAKLIKSKNDLQDMAQKLSQIEQQLQQSQSDRNSFDSPALSSDSVHQATEIVKPPTLHDKLTSSNIPLDTIQRIQSRVGENRLARLELRDKAIREDWLDTPEYIEQQQQLPSPTDGLREEFGDEIFDQYLYASGRPNRIIVREVFSGSAAAQAGIESGDLIISYASNPVYRMSDLQQATTEGYSGEIVLLELLRDDLPLSTSVPRGPLGISMSVINRQP